jgi:hypothetical protein
MTALIVLASVACSGTNSCTTQQVVLSSAGIAAAFVGTTVGITLTVENQHHTITGCVFSDDGGLKLRTSDSKIHTLEGNTALKTGDRVKFHGSKVKKAKGNDTGSDVFVVQELRKDYGPCPTALAASTAPR